MKRKGLNTNLQSEMRREQQMFAQGGPLALQQITIYDDEPQAKMYVSNLTIFKLGPNAQL